mmetsp:Transcript_10601/g.20097  ORF Transcript_10601/g.20097 Transcript_10601/m.20097 type:complete len:1047 (-) Transcript_10601:329-3469(-)|eukprot:CAMPEP_0175140116 /NCGR_PEP_ID=MMETSP0087-20121206/11283_1 /TAXON_ID=136419 /ORGANISM="Unknown Unknown, Strain D1" /LENGTH=1046 /DNA_ID=CAMNT_0016423209 /DNA_START=79 /DNA_END=3219 /DNA_ORIENTATION=-
MVAEVKVQVAVRVRPLLEMEADCRNIMNVTGKQISIGDNHRSFTFDHVFNHTENQKTVYESCVSPLVNNFIDGYNATILAYGQTGSGKTHTMGTVSNVCVAEQDRGILPRVAAHIFEAIKANPNVEYNVKATFLEIHNQDINDLLAEGKKSKDGVSIREDPVEGIVVTGVATHDCSDRHSMLDLLEKGSMSRTVGTTKMNSTSSRSHAIFTVFLSQRKKAAAEDEEDEVISSKFHFVDLAGSERLKRTGATGDRAQEGININAGLLALGNCISALADEKRKGGHVPFRDSKITRLLQDSLGGNSRTIMIACVSPADVNEEEGLNTLKYANRAKNIQNQAVINRDPTKLKLEALRRRVICLEQALTAAELPIPASTEMVDTCVPAGEGSSEQASKILFLTKDVKDLENRLQRSSNQQNAMTQELLNLTKQAQQYREAVNKVLSENLDRTGQEILETLQLATNDQESLFTAATASALSSVLNSNVAMDESNDKPSSLNIPECSASPSSYTPTARSRSESVDSMSSPDENSSGNSPTSTFKMANELNAMDNELANKEQLIAVLMKTAQDAAEKEQQYMQRINEMEVEVINTISQRDAVLKESRNKPESEETKKVLKKYQQKLSELQQKIKTYQSKVKENERLKKQYQKDELKIKKLENEIINTKKQRVILAQKIAEKNEVHREESKKREKTMRQMAKEALKAKLKMKKIEAIMEKREAILKRETEKNKMLTQKMKADQLKRENARAQKEALRLATENLQSKTLHLSTSRKRRSNTDLENELQSPTKKARDGARTRSRAHKEAAFVSPSSSNSRIPSSTRAAWKKNEKKDKVNTEDKAEAQLQEVTKYKKDITNLNGMLEEAYTQLTTLSTENEDMMAEVNSLREKCAALEAKTAASKATTSPSQNDDEEEEAAAVNSMTHAMKPTAPSTAPFTAPSISNVTFSPYKSLPASTTPLRSVLSILSPGLMQKKQNVQPPGPIVNNFFEKSSTGAPNENLPPFDESMLTDTKGAEKKQTFVSPNRPAVGLGSYSASLSTFLRSMDAAPINQAK